MVLVKSQFLLCVAKELEFPQNVQVCIGGIDIIKRKGKKAKKWRTNHPICGRIVIADTNATKQKGRWSSMLNYTTQTYQMKREIFNFTGKISKGLFRPAKKFLTDMCYGMMASGSCLLTEVAQKLHENAKKIKVVDRLSKHLALLHSWWVTKRAKRMKKEY